MINGTEKSNLLDAVDRAFGAASSFVEHDNLVLGGGVEYDRIVNSFRGKTWHNVNIEECGPCFRDSLSLLTPKAFHAYLPAYLVYCIHDPNRADFLIDNMIDLMTFHDYLSDSDHLFTRRIGHFTSEQCLVVSQFFQYSRQIYDDPIRDALLRNASAEWGMMSQQKRP